MASHSFQGSCSPSAWSRDFRILGSSSMRSTKRWCVLGIFKYKYTQIHYKFVTLRSLSLTRVVLSDVYFCVAVKGENSLVPKTDFLLFSCYWKIRACHRIESLVSSSYNISMLHPHFHSPMSGCCYPRGNLSLLEAIAGLVPCPRTRWWTGMEWNLNRPTLVDHWTSYFTSCASHAPRLPSTPKDVLW